MDSLQLEYYIRQSSKIFVWVQLSQERGLYVKTTKAALLEYLSSQEKAFDENIYIEFGEETQELYLGRAPGE